jgi:hypothetical protein
MPGTTSKLSGLRSALVSFLTDRLARGESVQEVFTQGSGYHLAIEQLARRLYRLDLGHFPGPDVGRGLSWYVAVDEDGEIVGVRLRAEGIA